MPTEDEMALPGFAWPGRQTLCLGLAALIVGALFILGRLSFAGSLFPAPWDKLAHFVVFGLLTVLFWTALGGRRPVLAVFATVLVGCFDEMQQVFLPGRHAGLDDLATDIAAALCAVIYLQVRSGRGKQPAQPVDR